MNMQRPLRDLRLALPGAPETCHEFRADGALAIVQYVWTCGCAAHGANEELVTVEFCLAHYRTLSRVSSITETSWQTSDAQAVQLASRQNRNNRKPGERVSDTMEGVFDLAETLLKREPRGLYDGEMF